MTSRKRNSSTSSSNQPRRKNQSRKNSVSHKSKRQRLMETLENRHLLAGPQLIGIQPNEGALIVDGTVRDTAPRVITFGFDANQSIDPGTFSGIQITRAGGDDRFGTADDVRIVPGLVTLGENDPNQVVVRFAESLPDDNYRIEVFGFDDNGLGVRGLRNSLGELFVPSDPNTRSEVIDFELRLGALVESVVPQPVIRNADNTLSQNRNEIVVYFNEDELFVENDDSGNPTERSAENPRFYQLLFTQETVRTTDDLRFHPDQVVYDANTHTARLIFSDDINDLAGVPQAGGTWRLRVGTAVDDRVDLILPPVETPVQATAVTDFQHEGLQVIFHTTYDPDAFATVESAPARAIRFEDTGAGGLTARLDPGGMVVFDFGGDQPEIRDLRIVALNTPGLNIDLTTSTAGGRFAVPLSVVGAPPLQLTAVGETLQTATDVGLFGVNNELKSLVFSESISPQPVAIEPVGGDDDPGHSGQAHINALFGADTTPGITDIPYNFQGIFDSDFQGNNFLNQITELQKTRIREVLNLWASEIGVQFRETENQGITFALGDTGDLQDRGGIFARNQFALNASVRVDPTFTNSALVFSNQTDFDLDYGEDFTRKAAAGVGLLLGLNQSSDLPDNSLMGFNFGFLNDTIDLFRSEEPVFPSNTDVLHGNYVHRADSVDIDLYRFVVDLNDADKVGTLTAETFAERLPDSSLLDTTLTLFEEVSASATTDFGFGPDLAVEITSLVPGRLGNNARLDFIQSDRASGDTAVRIFRNFDASGNFTANGITVDLPRQGTNVTSLPASAIVNAINNDPFASSIFRATITVGDGTEDVVGNSLAFAPILLDGGGVFQLSRNDDYFGEDSRIITRLGEGTYYVGVAASGNDHYDPTIPNSGEGGRSQGDYELHLKFEPQADEVDVIRDLDSDRVGVPGAVLDGDADGTPGGVHNFWFQTRPVNRILNFSADGGTIVAGQTLTVVGANGVSRTFEFTPIGTTARPGNIAVSYNPGTVGFPTPPGNLAQTLQAAINSRTADTGVSVSNSGGSLELVGERSISFSVGFRGIETLGRNIFVDKLAGPFADGGLDSPFNNINNSNVPNAFDSALPGDIVRIVGNGGLDNDITTEIDNLSYRVGVAETGGGILEDGRNMEVPQGVTTMIDAGSVFKLRNSFIGIGSSTVQVDRSEGALQVLGTPRLVQLSVEGDPISTTLIGDENVDSPGYDDGSVIFTSTRDRDVDAASAGISPAPSSGNWGGLIFRRDVDRQEGRSDLEDQGIFLQRVNHAELRYGGSSAVLINSVQQLVNPIQIVNMRPTITFNEITQSADSAISAAPDSFEETSFQEPRFQQAGAFTADYDRIGPEIANNRLVDNSINGLFIRSTTTPTETSKPITTSARFDDIDVVHYIAENLIIEASPGGSIQDGFAPAMQLVSGQELDGGSLPIGVVQYKMTFVDADGFESLESPDVYQQTITIAGASVDLRNLPQVETGTDYVSRRLYRADGGSSEFKLVAELDASSPDFVDQGGSGEEILDLNRAGIRGRLDASLVLDPGLVVKLRGTRIELGQGTQLLAEGLASNPIILASSQDDRFGAGGTFDTNNDNQFVSNLAQLRADWSGVYAGPTSNISFDNVRLSSAGGISLLEGGFSHGFSPLELQQAEGRITNSVFEFNQSGQAGSSLDGRFGRLTNKPSTIMVRGSQPIIVGNSLTNNLGSIIDIDVESFGANLRMDIGRQTGDNERIAVLDDNHGPLVRFNRYENNSITGLDIRGGTLDTETVFDDTDIAHLIRGDGGRDSGIIVGDQHSSGGLRLLSRPDESLVVKFSGSGSPNEENSGVGLTATGTVGSIQDRIGGSIHVIGLPGAPVILTSFTDDTVGAGLKPDGSQFTDHNGNGFGNRPAPNDWRGILLDQNSSDYNVAVIPELELSTEVAPGLNSDVNNAQVLGTLASNLLTGDHDRRLGFDVQGFLSGNTDVDVYSFFGTPGTEVWVDIDRTAHNVDTVIEVLDENGRVLARSDDSFSETALGGATDVTILDPTFEGVTSSLQVRDEQFTDRGVGGLYEDFESTNPRDAGIHFRLPGNTADPNATSVYFFRVRSASVNPDDAQGGYTGGSYQFQARITEDQMFPGSVIRHADIRYANNGIHLRGMMSNSPLLGEAQENEAAVFGIDNGSVVGAIPGSGAQYVGDFGNSRDNVIGVGGELNISSDVDFYRFDVSGGIQSTIVDVDYADGFNRPDTNISIFYDADGVHNHDEPPNFPPRLVYFGSASNIADDQTSPLGANDALEALIRGSVSDGDPFVGPVSLPNGSYYVAISSDGVVPSFLDSSVVEPINTITRIAEDRIGPDRSSPHAPVIPELFNNTSLANGAGFDFSVNSDAGHGTPNNQFTPPIQSPRTPEAAVGLGEADDSILTGAGVAANLDLLTFTLADDFEVGGGQFTNPTATSTTIPHVSIAGSLPILDSDFYQFTVTGPGTQRVILDIDGGFNDHGFEDDDDDPATPDVNTDPASIDLSLALLAPDPSGTGLIRVVPDSDTSNINDGAAGSNSTADPFIETTLAPGVYFIGVYDSTGILTVGATGATSTGATTFGTNTYTLHVSVGGVTTPPATTGQGTEVLEFERRSATGNGTVTSEPFDLAGYSPEDQPFLYFNRYYQPTFGDTATLSVTSDQSPTPTNIHTFTAGEWDQLRLPLANFAGDTGIQLTFDYTIIGPPANVDGLVLDDFIVGFAERGESVFGAASGDQFTGFGNGVSGEYQLEIRPGSDLSVSYDTNDRQLQGVTIVAPSGSQISVGDTFVLGDGATNQVFEFTPPGGITTPGNTRIAFTPTDTPADVAEAIRFALNSQTAIRLEAASSGGVDTGPLTDGRLVLSGNANGSFLSVPDARNVPTTPLVTGADGHIQLPAILHDGIGDENFLRPQGQVIIEHNTISDTHGIGIWSEPGDRDLVPTLARNNAYLEIPRLGNAYPGAVKNLPVLNNSVLGGLTPSLVIQNNTIDQARFAGVKVEGQIAPWAIESPLGDLVADGATFEIEAGGTVVTFEFEDIGDGDPPGSGVNGGDGVRDSNVPVYFRHTDNDNNFYLARGDQYRSLEILHAIRESIQGSILMTNGLVELVEVEIGPSLINLDPSGPALMQDLLYLTPALYVHGAGAITPVIGSSITTYQAPIYEAPQPFSRIINNTIYGSDGLESRFQENLLLSEPNDVLDDAVAINIGRSHRAYNQNAVLGDNAGPLPDAADVDFYRVFLEVGDRFAVDIDTLDADQTTNTEEGPATTLRIFDSSGVALAVSQNDIAPTLLDPQSTASTPVTDPSNVRDSFIDFVAPETGTYYVGVSSTGNDSYDPQALSGRVAGTGGVGDYSISAKVFTARDFVLSIDTVNNANVSSLTDDTSFTSGGDLVGQTFTVTLVDDLPTGAAFGNGNQVTFEFSTSNAALIGRNVNIPVAASTDFRVHDILVAMESSLNTAINGVTVLRNTAPIPSGIATALGGRSGNGPGLSSFPVGLPFSALYAPDFNSGGFAHNRAFAGNGTTELYVTVQNIAAIDIANAPSLTLDPTPGADTDQVLNETGVLVSGGASPTLLNNVFLNLHESLLVEPSSPKAMEVIAVGNVFQHDDAVQTQFNINMREAPHPRGAVGTSANPSNVNGGSDDFNITLAGGDPALFDAAGNDFQPRIDSLLIDSSVNSLNERSALVNLRTAVGLPISNILSPVLDEAGILRADHPDAAPPLGIGASVFNDRGSTELADFVGPVAIAEVPRDNDAEGIDSDPATGFINLTGGIYDEFRIQLRDTGDSSDPFTGVGIDDATVVVPQIPGLRPSGANITLFEDEQLLIEDIDYTFSYDETKNIITLTPLAGIWQNDRSYRIALNNRDQTVVVAPGPDDIVDGEQFAITDSLNGSVVFEFESGYQLLVPEAITLIVPQEGTNSGGLGDGDIFQIDDGVNPVVVFELNSDSVTLPGTVEVNLTSEATPNNDPPALAAFLNGIASEIRDAIQGEVDAGRLNVDVRVIDNQVVVGAEPGTAAQTSGSGLLQAGRTQGLRVPDAGAGIGGVADGDRFTITTDNVATVFEFSDGLAPVGAGSVAVDIAAVGGTPPNAAQVANAIVNALGTTTLGLRPSILGSTVYLNLPATGSAIANGGQLTVVGISRTPADGDTILVTPNNGATPLTFEINRTDEPDANGTPMDDGVSNPNIPINIARDFTASEIATIIANGLQGQVISGLNPNNVQVVNGGILSVGGEVGLGFTVDTSLEVLGALTSNGGSTINVGPLVLNMPTDGGLTLADGTVLVVRDNAFANVVFEFDSNNSVSVAGANAVPFTVFDDADELAASLASAINLAGIGIVAEAIGNAQLSLGQIDLNRVDTTNVPAITTQRGIPVDGEVITLRQGSVFVNYEFESADIADGVSPNNIPVVFQSTDNVGNVAVALSAAINANLGPLQLSATAVLDNSGNPTGDVALTDLRTTTLEVTGSPSVTGASTVEVFGPLLLNMPLVGGGGIQDGSVLIIQDDLGNDVLFEFDLNGAVNIPTATTVTYNSFDDVDQVSAALVLAINGVGIGVTAQYLGSGQISLGRIADTRVSTGGDLANGIPGVPQITTQRGIVGDQEIITIRQGALSVNFEFESITNGGGVTGTNVPVAFQPGSTVGDVALSLAAAINNNLNGLRLSAVAELDANGNANGLVQLNDLPGTVVDVSQAPTLNVTGVPGGAIPVRISPAFTELEIKQALLQAFNSINPPGQLPVTTLTAQDRGGSTLFVENGTIFGAPLQSYFLPGIQDLSGNPLEANRQDASTQFTILMPTVSLDFGDAPDPAISVPGRYPTRLSSDGPRHVVGGLRLGSLIDANVDGLPVPNANGDDLQIRISETGGLFATAVTDGVATIQVRSGAVDPALHDGDTVTITTEVGSATLEFDLNGRFNEDNFAIQPADLTDASITAAIIAAIAESPISPASVSASGAVVSISGDDEDGVVFTSSINPNGIFNKDVVTPIDVTVTGGGILQAWIDFNADGDWDDPGENVITAATAGAIFTDAGGPVTRTFTITVPEITPDPPVPVSTYARFRVSREGGLEPTGLALSGEVEDYVVTMVPGSGPDLGGSANRTYVVGEDLLLQALDANGTLTPASLNDDGILEGVVDPDGDPIAIVAEDVRMQTLLAPDGTVGGVLNLMSDGTFTFTPEEEFSGEVSFSARVTDLHPLNPTANIVSSTPISVTINVVSVNDPPEATSVDVEVNRTINEDEVQTFLSSELIAPFFIPGPPNEAGQPLIIQSASSTQRGPFLTSLGGRLVITNGGSAIEYTPPLDVNGGTTPDTFTYVVADIPPDGELSEVAIDPTTRQQKLGTVSITINAVNDPPRVSNETYNAQEDTSLTIPIDGAEGILANDTPGPADEVAAGQTISLQTSNFPVTTFRGGSVDLQNGALLYSPPALFSGLDQFSYIVEDSVGATSEGTVNVVVGGTDNAPVFVGVNGNPSQTSLSFDESKQNIQQFQFDLQTWFQDPENDAITFEVSSQNSSLVQARLVTDTLVLDLPRFAFGTTNLEITATSSGLPTTVLIPVTVVNTPDPPTVIDTLDPAATNEDVTYVGDLTTVFADPDGEPLQYSVARIGSIINPTIDQIAQHPLLSSIQFFNDEVRVTPQQDQSGSVEIEIAATDGSFRVSDTFTLTVSAVADSPIATEDAYVVPVGSTLQVLNPANGLLRNDSDADGDAIAVDLNSVSTPSRGTVSVESNGTFVYTNTSGVVGDTDSFTYRTRDVSGRVSDVVTVMFTLNQSRYQNPLADMATDVTADGFVTALDALRILNLLNSRLDGQAALPVSEIGAPPPDYVDVSGDGRVSAQDALLVINQLNQRNNLGQGEFVDANFATTTSFASLSSNLPVSNVSPAIISERESGEIAVDQILSSGVQISATTPEKAIDSLSLVSSDDSSATDEAIDDALNLLVDEISLINLQE